MKTKRLDFNYRSLVMSSYIELIGSLPTKQSYDAVTGEYAPDYTLAGSHLVFQPHVVVMSDEQGAEHGDVTASSNLTNIKWTEVTTSTSTVITPSNTNYEITTSGANKGRIVMKRNVPAASSITLVFEADYYDARKSETHHQRQSVKVSCETEGTLPVISTDKPTSNLWNPFRDGTSMTFNCFLKHGSDDVPVASRTFVWEKKRKDGSWSQIGSDAYDDFGWSVTNNGATYTQDMKFIGERQDMRVRAATSSIPLTPVNESMAVYFTIVRRLPDFDYDYKGVPDNIEPETVYVYPEAYVEDREGLVPSAQMNDNLLFEWYTAAGTASGNPTMTLYCSGPTAQIPTSQINQNGMVLGLNATDRGNWKVVYQGNAVVMHDGKVVIGK